MSENPSGGSYTPPPPPPLPPGDGGTGGGGDLVYPTTPPKDPILVLVLNLLLFGGVGYIIIGQKMKGIIAIIIWAVIVIPTCGAGACLIAIIAAIDGYMQAQQLQAGHPVAQWTFFNDHR
jgi:TM2 domain-containing membrane protein YozV